MSKRQFPIIWQERGKPIHGCPTSIPWDCIAGHENQAQLNHGQTLDRLAERGGLAPTEAFAIILNVDFFNFWRDFRKRRSLPEGSSDHTEETSHAVTYLNRWVEEYIKTDGAWKP